MERNEDIDLNKAVFVVRGYRVCVPVSPFFVLRCGEYGGKGRICACCRGFIKRKSDL